MLQEVQLLLKIQGFNLKKLDRIRSWVQQLVKEKKIPFASVLVARFRNVCVALTDRKGTIVFRHDEGVSSSSLFRIFSMTKPITSVAIMMLVEDGKLRLTDPLHKYIPSFAPEKMHVYTGPTDGDENILNYQREPVRHAITIEHLLTHTSGLSHAIDETGMFHAIDPIYVKLGVRSQPHRSDFATLQALVDHIATLPLVHQPGERWSYSFSPDILGRVVEVASGLPFAEFLQQRIFDPLQMKGAHPAPA